MKATTGPQLDGWARKKDSHPKPSDFFQIFTRSLRAFWVIV